MSPGFTGALGLPCPSAGILGNGSVGASACTANGGAGTASQLVTGGWAGLSVCPRRPTGQGHERFGGCRRFWVAGFVRGTGFSQGGGPFRRGFLRTGRRPLLGGTRPVRSRGLRLGGRLLPLLRGGRWLPGRALLLLCDHHQQVLAHRLRQHRLLYPRRRPWRISCTGHAAWQRRNTVVLCHLSHPPRRMTMHASDSATYRNYRFDRNSTLSSSLYGLYVYHLVPVSAVLASRIRGG